MNYEYIRKLMNDRYVLLKSKRDLDYRSRFDFFLQSVAYAVGLVKAGSIDIPNASNWIINYTQIFTWEEIRKNSDIYAVFDISASLEVGERTGGRSFSDWKIIEDFIQKYGAEIN